MKYKIITAIILLLVSLNLSGCLESRFQLSSESRLPKWFAVPDGMSREDLSVQMELYSTFSGGKAVFTLSQNNKLFNISEYEITTVEQPSIRSVQLKYSPSNENGYPRYKVITINGIRDVIELRKKEPFFYMTDDINVWRELGIANYN